MNTDGEVMQQLTPSWAARLLGQTRPRNPLRAMSYAIQIRNGQWTGTTTIEINSRGELVDGRHRCWAVLKADRAIPVELVVRYDLETVAE